jgi:hypothetical protein
MACSCSQLARISCTFRSFVLSTTCSITNANNCADAVCSVLMLCVVLLLLMASDAIDDFLRDLLVGFGECDAVADSCITSNESPAARLALRLIGIARFDTGLSTRPDLTGVELVEDAVLLAVPLPPVVAADAAANADVLCATAACSGFGRLAAAVLAALSRELLRTGAIDDCKF